MIYAYIAYTHQITGVISHIQSFPSDPPDNGSTRSNGELVTYLREDELKSIGFASPSQFLVNYFRKNGAWIYRGTSNPEWTVWNSETESWDIASDRVSKRVLELRLAKLYQSDWTQGIDSPLTDEKKAEWITYRQALRDITIPSDLALPTDFVWPTEPS
jgi:hypothetical protein